MDPPYLPISKYLDFKRYTKEQFYEEDHRELAKEVEELLDTSVETDFFVSTTFKGLYFKDEENHLIDCIRANIKKMKNKYKRAIAMTALIRAALKKRPRGVFTYIGERYNDGRRDLKISFRDQFIRAVKVVNQAVFSNGKEVKRWEAGLDMKLHVRLEDVQYIVDTYK